MGHTKQVAFRFEGELVDRLDAYAEELSNKTPGMQFTRADAVRVLLSRGLDESGVKAKSTRPKEAQGGKRGRSNGT